VPYNNVIYTYDKRRKKDPLFIVNESRSVADWDPGSGIRCLFYPGIRNGVKIKIRTRDEHPGSYFRVLGNNFLDYKYFNSLMQIRIGIGNFLNLDPGWKHSDPG
jgi:hypothetical protein